MVESALKQASRTSGCLLERWVRWKNEDLSLTSSQWPSGPHLENLLVQQTGSEHRDAIGVDLCVAAAGKR